MGVEKRNRDLVSSVVRERLALSKWSSLLPSPSSPPLVVREPFEESSVSVEQEVQVRRPLIQSRVMIDDRRHRFGTCLPHPIDSVHRKSLHPLRSLPPVHHRTLSISTHIAGWIIGEDVQYYFRRNTRYHP